jgi:dTMP kinase
MRRYKGFLLALEGIDGSGKSTLATAIHDHLLKQQIKTILTKEPGGTPLGVAVRKLLQERPVAIAPRAEFLLFAADRAQHFEEKIIPALEQGTVVISDRMADSALVYQGYGRGLDRNYITTINTWAMQDVRPDITIYVRIDVPTARARIAQRPGTPSVFDTEKEQFFERLIAGFDELYRDRSDVIIIDGTQTPEVVAATTIEKVVPWIR